MKTEFLKDLGVSEDIISKIMAENGKDIQREKDKAADVAKQLEAAQKQVQELSDAVKNGEGKDGTIADLQKKVKAYEDAEAARKKAEEAAQARQAIKARFDPLRGDNEFLNEGTAEWMLSQFEAALADKNNVGKSDADIYNAIAKDKNIYVNPHEPFKNPPVNRQQNVDGVEAAFLARNPHIKL